jgi:hypothetical protein
MHARDLLVTACGRIGMHRKRVNISTVLAGQRRIKDVDAGIWRVSFMRYDLGYIDPEQKTLQPIDKSANEAINSFTYQNVTYAAFAGSTIPSTHMV